MTIDQINNIPFVFVVGRGRSGTTLLQNIIDANSHAVLARESKIIIHLKQKYSYIKSFTPKVIDELITDLYKDRFFELFWKVDAKKLAADLKSYPSEKLSFSIVCKIIYLHYTSFFEKDEIHLIGDKNPAYSVFIPELLEVFPDAKFIHIIRDYRDNVVSNSKAFGEKSLGYLAYGWLIFNQKIDEIKHQRPNKFYTLRYEDLVETPEKITKEICQFLGLTFQENMITIDKSIKKLPINLPKNHRNLLQPINTSQVGKFSKILSQKNLELMDYICGDFAKRYNYYRTTQIVKPSFLLKLLWYKIRFVQFYTIIKTYYLMPFFVRDVIRTASNFIYKFFNFSTKYNKVELAAKTNSL